MDIRTERLLASLQEMATNIEIVQSYLRSGHDLNHRELEEWEAAVRNHGVVYETMILLLLPDASERVH